MGREVAFAVSKLPVGWLYDVSPAKVEVERNSTNRTTLILRAPADAAPGTTHPFLLQANDANGLGQADPLPLNVTIVAPPSLPPNQPVAPSVAMTLGSASAPAGAAAEGILTLYTEEAQLPLSLTVSGDASWRPRFPENDFVRLYSGVPAEVRLAVDVPSTLAAGTERTFTITARHDSFSYTATWRVTALEAVEATGAPTPPTPATTDSGPAAPTGDAATTGTAPTTPALGLETVAPDSSLAVAPGGTTSGTLTLRNTGAQTLRLALHGDAADGWPVALDPDTVTLTPGLEIDVAIRVQAPADLSPGGTGSGTVTITGENGLLRTVPFQLAIVQGAQPFATQPVRAETADAPVPAGATMGPGTILAVSGLAAVGAGALVIARRPWREKLVWGAIGLYTRLARPDVLGHEEREKLYRAIETQPGIHFHAVQRDLSWNTGTLTYHLRVLERHGFVVSRRDGPYRRFYVQGAAPKKEAFNPDAPHGLRADVLEAIRNQHGISQTDLAMALGANKQTVNYHVKALERAGTIRVEKRGRDTFLYPSGAPGVGAGEVHA